VDAEVLQKYPAKSHAPVWSNHVAQPFTSLERAGEFSSSAQGALALSGPIPLDDDHCRHVIGNP
jgi:hypothetical protein